MSKKEKTKWSNTSEISSDASIKCEQNKSNVNGRVDRQFSFLKAFKKQQGVHELFLAAQIRIFPHDVQGFQNRKVEVTASVGQDAKLVIVVVSSAIRAFN